MCTFVSQNAFIHTRVASMITIHSMHPPSVNMAETVELPVERAVLTEYSSYESFITRMNAYICIPSPVFLFGGEMLI